MIRIMFFLSFLQKINARNAFGLHLIDYMLEMLQKRGELSNFQVILAQVHGGYMLGLSN